MPTAIESQDSTASTTPVMGEAQAEGYSEFKKRAVFVIVAVIAGLLGLGIVWQARIILLVLFAGFLGALILTTLTSLVQKWLGIRRVFAFALLLAGVGVALALGVWLRGPELLQQFGQLQVDLPAAARRLYVSMDQSRWGRWILDNTHDSGEWSGWFVYAAAGIKGAVWAAASTIAGLLLIVMASIYLAAEPGFYRKCLQQMVPGTIWVIVEPCLQSAIHTLRYWLLSRLLSMTAIGLIVVGGLWLLGVPMPGTLGIIAALLTFVPNIGPLVSAVPAALLAFSISPTKGLLSLGLFCAAHFIEGNFVTPISDRQIVKLPPFLTLSLQLVMAPVTGALGVALAAPLLATILGVSRALHSSGDGPRFGSDDPPNNLTECPRNCTD